MVECTLDQGVDQFGKVFVTRDFGRKPEVVSPRFELVGAQDPSNSFRGNAVDDAVGFELASQFGTIPLGERATHVVRSFTSKFHECCGLLLVRTRECGQDGASRLALPLHDCRTAWPICANIARARLARPSGVF